MREYPGEIGEIIFYINFEDPVAVVLEQEGEIEQSCYSKLHNVCGGPVPILFEE